MLGKGREKPFSLRRRLARSEAERTNKSALILNGLVKVSQGSDSLADRGPLGRRHRGSDELVRHEQGAFWPILLITFVKPWPG